MAGPRLTLAAAAISICVLAPYGCTAAAEFAGPWDKYILAPQSRSLNPVGIFRKTGNTTAISDGHHGADMYILTGPNASVTFDFGQETAGIPTIHYGPRTSHLDTDASLPSQSCTGTCQALGLAYTESAAFVGFASDFSNALNAGDGTVYLPILQSYDYTVPARWGRGSFRYLTLSLGNTTSTNTVVEIDALSLYFTAEPALDERRLRDYTGYFYSSDELLNRIWYAGVWTAQLCTVGGNTSVNASFLPGTIGWAQDVTIDNFTGSNMVFTDGAKRDRVPWTGDLSISLNTALVSRNYDNLVSVKNNIIANIDFQDPQSGYFPWGGPPIAALLAALAGQTPLSAWGSDTYHLYAIIAYSRYVLVTSDVSFATKYWPNIKRGIEAVYPFINPSTGLFNGTRTEDWGRNYQSGENTALNALLYGALNLLVRVAPLVQDAGAGGEANNWLTMASRIKESANALLFDTSAGLYVDNSTAAGHRIYPQDCNVLAVTYNLTDSAARAATVSSRLRTRWTAFGAPTPELEGTISPFISSSEVLTHFLANPTDSSAAVGLIRLQWGYMLSAFSQSSTIEGYDTNGGLNYGFAQGRQPFVSFAHSWSTGPTWSMLEFLVGIRATPLGAGLEDNDSARTKWIVQPQINGSGLTFAKGGYHIPDLGSVEAEWSLDQHSYQASNGQHCHKALSISVTTPTFTSGTINVPLLGSLGQNVTITLDRLPVTNWHIINGGFANLLDIKGGQHKIRVEFC